MGQCNRRQRQFDQQTRNQQTGEPARDPGGQMLIFPWRQDGPTGARFVKADDGNDGGKG